MFKERGLSSEGLLKFVIPLSLILSFGLGFFLSSSLKPNPTPKNDQEQQKGDLVKISPVFDNQVAYLNGKITKLNGDTATVQNLAGKSDDFPLAKGILIYFPPNKNSSASPSSTDLKDIQLNKDAFISLGVVNGKFEISSISYTLPTSNPKVSTPSATPKGGR